MNVTRGDLHDWYVEGDESAVFVGNQVMVLSPLATAILEIVGERTVPVPDLAAELVQRFGDPGGDVEELTRRLLQELAADGVVRLSG